MKKRKQKSKDKIICNSLALKQLLLSDEECILHRSKVQNTNFYNGDDNNSNSCTYTYVTASKVRKS